LKLLTKFWIRPDFLKLLVLVIFIRIRIQILSVTKKFILQDPDLYIDHELLILDLNFTNYHFH